MKTKKPELSPAFLFVYGIIITGSYQEAGDGKKVAFGQL